MSDVDAEERKVVDDGPQDGDAHPETPPGSGDDETPELVKATVGGQEFELDPALAAALTKDQDAASARTEELEGHVGDLRRQFQTPSQDQQQGQGPDYEHFNQSLFEDPASAVQEIVALTEQRVLQQVGQANQQQRGLDQFWGDFYTANPELKEFDSFVKAQMNESWQTIADMPAAKGASKLAELTRESLLGMSRKLGKGKKGSGSQHSESGGGPRTPAKGLEEGGNVISASEQIRKRQNARLKQVG